MILGKNGLGRSGSGAPDAEALGAGTAVSTAVAVAVGSGGGSGGGVAPVQAARSEASVRAGTERMRPLGRHARPMSRPVSRPASSPRSALSSPEPDLPRLAQQGVDGLDRLVERDGGAAEERDLV